ncbi:hypothetical protein [Paenibacillus gansuensis]|uniref:Uncharacterized protein n=1 Tax=Paenibacillus gansuensis TaxID=306542 RepID=A0ABW5P940_9BACL
MYFNGQVLTADQHFDDHRTHEVPVQVYYEERHHDIGYIESICPAFVRINNIFYNRTLFTFISRPGY